MRRVFLMMVRIKDTCKSNDNEGTMILPIIRWLFDDQVQCLKEVRPQEDGD